jgi:hypothetical protein
MVLKAAPHYDEELTLYAQGGERYSKGEMSLGSSVTLRPEHLECFEDIIVQTESMTAEERRAAVADWAVRKQLGISTRREGLAAAGYTDEAAQLKALAEEEAAEIAATAFEAQIPIIVQDRIRLRAGVLVPLAPPMMGAPGAAPGMGGAGPMRPPVTDSAAGSSAPVA